MKKKILSVTLAIVLIFSLSIPCFADFSDLNGHWAKTYMEDLASRGYLNGYSDGTMKPDKNITSGETLVVLSRMYSPSALQTSLMQDDYDSTVKSVVASGLSWEYPYIETCLAAGIITVSELNNIKLTDDITKEQLSVFLVRAMQLTDAAGKLGASNLKFADTSKITSSDAGAVAELFTIGIVTGDDKNNFTPQSSVTRAVAATMISRALIYLNTNKTTLTLSAYDGVTKSEGIITSVSVSCVDVSGFDGLAREYTLTTDSAVTVNGSAASLGTTNIGCHAAILSKNGSIKKLAIDSNTTESWTRGVVTSISTGSGSANCVNIREITTGKYPSYTVISTTSIVRDGATATLSNILAGDYVSIKYNNYNSNSAEQIYAQSKFPSLTGVITSLNLDSTVVMKLKDSSSNIYVFGMDISALPTIKRGDAVSTIDKLRVGDSVTVSFTNSAISQIASSGSSSTVTGTLVSSTTTASGTVWVLSVGGVNNTYTLDDDVSAFQGTTKIALSDINVGDQVSVNIFNNAITGIKLMSGVAEPTVVSGTILVVDTYNRKVTLRSNSDKLVYVDTSALSSIIVANTGNSLYIGSLTKGSTVTAYGSYSNSNTFAARTMVVTALAS